VVVAQIFAVRPDRVDEFAGLAEAAFAAYRAAGAREAGVLVTLDAPNNFPHLPIRTDGPFLVWLGVVADDARACAGCRENQSAALQRRLSRFLARNGAKGLTARYYLVIL
jgi:hypothetical protein